MGKEELDYLKKINFSVTPSLGDKKVLIYGAGLLFEEAYKNYDFSKLNILGISDKKFEEENAPESFLGLKTYRPNEIKTLNPDYILISLKEYHFLSNILTQNYQIKVIPLFPKTPEMVFEKRNLNPTANIQLYGLHNKKKNKNKITEIKKKYIKLKTKINDKLGKIDIPQIEFTITTKCTLRCKHCCNYIPDIKDKEHCITSFEDFKIQLDNLLKAVHSIHNLILIGGEPLLVKNLNEYLEYACSKKQVKNVWIVTNGTLLLKDELLKSIKKYNKKITIWISNYSKNETLLPKLKHEKILEQINNTKADFDYVQDLCWSYSSPINNTKLRDDSKFYFEKCNNNCVAVFGGKIYVCPRAGVFDIKNFYTPENNEIIDLNFENNPRILRKKLRDFYCRETFTACNYCTVLEDKTKEKVIPALQLD